MLSTATDRGPNPKKKMGMVRAHSEKAQVKYYTTGPYMEPAGQEENEADPETRGGGISGQTSQSQVSHGVNWK